MRPLILRRVMLPAFLVVVCLRAFAGGPGFIAGSAFNPSAAGKPLVWLNGAIGYYTDQGDLSPLLPQSAANAFVADAFSRWTSVNTAALTATRLGSLNEDVNGSNVTSTVSGVTLPADVQVSSSKSFAVIYDFDGQVIDALLGSGASDPLLCSSNSVLGGVDRFSNDGHIAHALLIINGRCALAAADLAPLKYRLVRAIGRVLGLGWSQANDNVQTGTPFPTSQDYAGFALMHPLEPFCAGAITSCIPSADQLRMDDRAAVSRLYPVTLLNLSLFPGKQVFLLTTARIHGSIYFPDTRGNPGQPMQGLNVVARLIDPVSGLPSRSAVVTSVSGFLFRGNAGNPVSGYGSPRFDGFGGSDPGLEGFFDLAGLEIPSGQTINVQLTLEAINPLYHDDSAVGPYSTGLVTPSGVRQTIVVANLSAGSDVVQDVVMSAAPPTRATDGQSILQRVITPDGDWWGTIAGYGRFELYDLRAQANRTVGIQVTSMNASLRPVTSKLRPELGLWNGSSPFTSLPQSHADFFNDPSTATTTLIAPVSSAGTVQLGIADDRGDGRPDFIYHAHVLYADAVVPPNIAGRSGPVLIRGIGFRQGVSVSIAGAACSILSVNQSSILVQPPALSNGTKTVSVTDAISGMSVNMTSALNVGTLATDTVLPVSSANPIVAVGTTAPFEVRFRAVRGDGVTPVAGSTVTLSVSPTTSRLNACGSDSCVLTADANGEVSTYVTVNASGANIVTASLANGQQQQSTINGASTMMLLAITPQIRAVSGTSATFALPARVMSSGAGVSGRAINYSLVSGSGSLPISSALTDSSGNAGVNLAVSNLTTSVIVDACSSGLSCVRFSVTPVPPSGIALKTVSGNGQAVLTGVPLQPLVLRVTDSSSPPNAMAGIPVVITGNVFATAPPDCSADTGVCRPPSPHVFATINTTLTSDANGIVTYTPSVQNLWGAVEVNVMASAGTNASQNFNLQIFAPTP